MPIDSSIALAGKPPVIAPVDVNATFRTLSQLKYQQAETQKVQEEAARTQSLFDEAGAFRQRLSALGTVPVGGTAPVPATGGPPFDAQTLGALAQGESTPAPTAAQPGTAPTARRRSILDPDFQAELYGVAPHAADDLLKTGIATHSATLKAQQELYENVMRSLPAAGDEAGYQAWRATAQTLLPPGIGDHFPDHDPGVAGRKQMQDNALALETQFKQQIEASTVAIAQQTEKRLAREHIVLPGIEQSILVPKYPEGPVGTPSTSPAGTSTPATPGTPGTGPAGIGIPVPGTEKSLSGEEAKAKANYDLAAASLERLLGHEATLGSAGPNPTRDLNRIAPSVVEHGLANHASGVTTAAVAGIGTALGALGGPWGAGIGAGVGAATGRGVGGIVDAAANKLLSPERQAYNGEQLNFIAAVRGEETSRLSPETIQIERDRYFPKPGDTEPEILRKRQVRADAVSAMATRTNRRQGTIPLGQKPATPAPSSPKVFTMEQAWATSRAYGRPVEDVVRDAKQHGWTVQ